MRGRSGSVVASEFAGEPAWVRLLRSNGVTIPLIPGGGFVALKTWLRNESRKLKNASAAYPAKNAKLAALKLTAPGNPDDPDMARRSPSRASHKAAFPDAVKMSRATL
jgi:hypothetical protein